MSSNFWYGVVAGITLAVLLMMVAAIIIGPVDGSMMCYQLIDGSMVCGTR